MRHRIAMSLLLVAMLCPAAAQQEDCDRADIRATFLAPDGEKIELDTSTNTIHLPHSSSDVLYDCSDKTNICLTDHHGFAFSISRECDDIGTSNDRKQPKLYPKIVSVLHGNLWLVFDASPNYLFHYVIPKGIVGIYIGRLPSFDFRSLFHDQNLKINKIDATEYRLVAQSGPVAACRERQ